MPALSTLNPITQAFRLHRVFQTTLLGSSLSMALCLPLSAQVMAQEVDVDIAAMPLSASLQAFGRQADQQVLFSPDDVQGLNGRAVKGRLTAQQALATLLAGTGLAYDIQGNSVTIHRRGNDTSSLQLDATTVRSQPFVHRQQQQCVHQAAHVPARNPPVGQRHDPSTPARPTADHPE